MTAIHALAFFQHASGVQRLLHFDEGQRHAVDQQGDVRAEFVFAVHERQFGDDMPTVVGEVVEIDHPQVAACGQTLVESLAQVFVLQVEMDVVEQAAQVGGICPRIDAGKRRQENVREDVVARIPSHFLQREISVAQPGQMQERRDLDPGILIELRHPALLDQFDAIRRKEPRSPPVARLPQR